MKINKYIRIRYFLVSTFRNRFQIWILPWKQKISLKYNSTFERTVPKANSSPVGLSSPLSKDHSCFWSFPNVKVTCSPYMDFPRFCAYLREFKIMKMKNPWLVWADFQQLSRRLPFSPNHNCLKRFRKNGHDEGRIPKERIAL